MSEKYMKYCPTCAKNKDNPTHWLPNYVDGYIDTTCFLVDDKCLDDHDIIDTKLLCDDYDILAGISKDKSFIDAMVKLAEEDPIEFQLKMTQFRAGSAVVQQNKEQDNRPKCPTCGSTSITSGARGVNLTWGIIGASKTVNRCSNCGHTWKPKK